MKGYSPSGVSYGLLKNTSMTETTRNAPEHRNKVSNGVLLSTTEYMWLAAGVYNKDPFILDFMATPV